MTLPHEHWVILRRLASTPGVTSDAFLGYADNCDEAAQALPGQGHDTAASMARTLAPLFADAASPPPCPVQATLELPPATAKTSFDGHIPPPPKWDSDAAVLASEMRRAIRCMATFNLFFFCEWLGRYADDIEQAVLESNRHG